MIGFVYHVPELAMGDQSQLVPCYKTLHRKKLAESDRNKTQEMKPKTSIKFQSPLQENWQKKGGRGSSITVQEYIGYLHFLTSNWKGPVFLSILSVWLHISAQILFADIGSNGVFFRYCFSDVFRGEGVFGGILNAMAFLFSLSSPITASQASLQIPDYTYIFLIPHSMFSHAFAGQLFLLFINLLPQHCLYGTVIGKFD